VSIQTKDNLGEWLKAFLPVIIAAIIAWFALAKAVSGLEIRQDLANQRLNERVTENFSRIDKVDNYGTNPTKLHTEEIQYLTTRIDKVEVIQVATSAAVSDMRSDLRSIADWVKEQRQKSSTK